jgi:hypothetical protein
MRPRLLLIGLAASAALLAQGNFGSITGTVGDSSGAMVPGAKVEAVNLATGLKLATETSTAGIYLIPNVPVGEYRLTASAPSFKTFRRQPVIVSTGSAVGVDVGLEIGAVTETVTVRQASTQLDLATSAVGAVLGARAIKQLPLDITSMDQGSSGIRQPQQFMFMTPGVTGTSFAHRMSGSQTNSQSIQIDGHNWMLLNNPGRLVSNPPPFDAIEEFKVNTAQFSAENPVGTGGTQFSFKSGTDEYHGAIFHLMRNEFFNARGFFARQVSPLKLNESSISFGGPVRLPWYNGKNRTHFYGTFTRFSRRGLENAASLTTVPTEAFKRGDFSGWVDARGVRIPVYDPATTRANGRGGFTRDEFPGGAMPASRITRVARNAMALMPNPQLPGVLNNFPIVGANTENWEMYSMKFDHSWTSTNTTRVTYWFTHRFRKVISGYPGQLAPDDSTVIDAHNIMLSHTSVLSPRIVNEVRWSLAPWIPNQVNAGLFGESGTELLGIPNHPSGAGIMPILSITNLGINLGNAGRQPIDSTRRNFSFGDSLTWIRGKHQLKFGGTGVLSLDDTYTFLNRMGTFSFNNRSTSQPDSANVGALGHGFASFLLGEVFSATRLLGERPNRERVRRFEGFVQDDYRVDRRLTLNLGLNYHIPFVFVDGDDQLSAMDPRAPNPRAGNLPGAMVFAGSGPGRTGRRTLADNYFGAFAPRFGFAFALNQKTVLRGGHGFYYGMAPGHTTINGSPREGNTFVQSETTLDQGITPAFNINNGFPVLNLVLPQIDPALKNGSSAIYVHPESRKPPLSLNWSFGVQRELPGSWFVDASYVANKGTRLPSQLENINQLSPGLLRLGTLLNQNIASAAAAAAGIRAPYAGFTGTVSQALRPFPQYTSVSNLFQGNGYSTYHSLQMKVDKRFSRGFMVMNAYTLSKLIDTGGSARGSEDPSAMDTFNRHLEKALAADDQTHTLVTSFIYELPFGIGRPYLHSNKVLANVIGNWRISGSLRYFSGNPLSIGSAQAMPLFGGGNRPNRVEGTEIIGYSGHFDPGRDRYLNRAAFTEPAPLTFGTMGRTLPNVRGPAFFNENFAVAKEIRFRETHTIELRGTMLNALNRTVFSNPVAGLASPDFGRITGQRNLPRQLELQFHYRF